MDWKLDPHVLSYADEYHYQYHLANQWMPSSDLHWMKRGFSIHSFLMKQILKL